MAKVGFTVVVDVSLPENSVILLDRCLSILDGAVRRIEVSLDLVTWDCLFALAEVGLLFRIRYQVAFIVS